MRLHVIANSDDPEDQAQKLLVRDAVLDYLNCKLQSVNSSEEAERVIQENIAEIKGLAEATQGYPANVTISEEAFGVRHYDTFSLPAGVYTSLRIELGNANGKNWWCVVFPSLCAPTSQDSFKDVAASSGFSDDLADSLTKREKVTFRFFLLDLFGRVENFFFCQ